MTHSFPTRRSSDLEDVSSDALRGREDVERSPHGAGDDAMLEQIRGHVRSLDQRHGREYDEQSERISHSLLALAKDKGLARIDHVVLSGKSEFVRSPGQNILDRKSTRLNSSH